MTNCERVPSPLLQEQGYALHAQKLDTQIQDPYREQLITAQTDALQAVGLIGMANEIKRNATDPSYGFEVVKQPTGRSEELQRLLDNGAGYAVEALRQVHHIACVLRSPHLPEHIKQHAQNLLQNDLAVNDLATFLGIKDKLQNPSDEIVGGLTQILASIDVAQMDGK